MKNLPIIILILYCHRSLGTLVVELDESSNENTFLALDKGIEINNPLTFCLRFNIKDSLATNYIFSSTDDKLVLILRFSINLGILLINRVSLVFEIPKDNGVLPFHWHHICASTREDSYTIVLDGQQWYHASHKLVSSEKITLNRLDLGSTKEYWTFSDGIDFKGLLSELNIWSKSLSVTQMVKITRNCGKIDPIPDLLKWSELPNSTIRGSKHMKNIENICHDKNATSLTYKILPYLHDQDNAIHVCKILDGELAFPNSVNELQTWDVPVSENACVEEFVAPMKKSSSGFWINENNNEIVDMDHLWDSRSPNGKDFEKCTGFNAKDSKYFDTPCNSKKCFICSWKGTPVFTLRGLCTNTQVDEQFVLLPEKTVGGNVFFFGIGNGNIIFNEETGSWLIVINKAKEIFKPDGISLDSLDVVGAFKPDRSDAHHLPVGTHFWNLTENCNKVMQLKLTQCKINQFTCSDGTCIDLKGRCNNVFDCSDGSDESVCEPLSIHKKNYRKAFPPFTGSNKTNIHIRIFIGSIESIDELAMTFTSEVAIFLRWRDERITFSNLDQGKNILSKDWQDQIWLPSLYFSNTKENKDVLSGNSIEVGIIPHGQATPNKKSELNEANTFKGEENDLELESWNDLTFKCNFELWRYPFDVQHCSVDVKIQTKLRNFTILNPIEVTYAGEMALNQFNIRDFTISLERSWLVRAKFTLKRNPSFLIMNAYLPSFFTMVMTIASLFLNDQLHFSTTIMLVLTSQLCLYTLFQSSLEGIPQTAYMKMIDYWNMLAMTASLTNFFTLFLWEILKLRGIRISRFTLEYNQLKITTRIVIPLITLLGVTCYWIMAGALYFETNE